MRITARLIIHCILPMDGIDGEGRIKRMSPKGINRKPSKSFNQDFPTLSIIIIRGVSASLYPQ